MIRLFLIFGVLGLAGSIMQAQMVVLPYQSTLSLPEASYGVQLCKGKCTGLMGVKDKKTGKMNAVLTDVDGTSSCPVDGRVGLIKLASSDTPAQQRKILIHEVIHIALACDHRDRALEERIAEDVAALYDDRNFHDFMVGDKR